MSTLSAIPAAVKSGPAAPVVPLGLGHYLDPMLDSPEPAARAAAFRMLAREGVPAAPVETAPADADDRAPYSADDQAWWADHCDHAGWTRDGELSPEERDAELEHLDRYNAALEAMFEASYLADRIEAGCYAW